MNSITDFKKFKKNNTKITMVTCYDFWSAQIIDESDVDAVLVGDSTAMVMHGYKTTINATVEMLAQHTAAVRRGLINKLIIADLPFLAHKKGRANLINSVDILFKAGAEAVKIEGINGITDDLYFLTKSGIPVMGHLGLTPQSVHKFGGFNLQGKTEKDANQIIVDAKRLEDTGVFAIVLEMIPSDLAREITESLEIPTIGIGAGKYTSGQILVLQDLLGLSKSFNPKFLRKYMDGDNLITTALNSYSKDVRENSFPSDKESY